jgi:hypothetical protein|tara:strand:+ start:56 stop:379 length:324 start_codon:yes stop_codon:yes gene_type:complete
MKEDKEKYRNAELKPSAITPDGMWVLPDGHKCDLRHVQLQLPDGRGEEWVLGVILSAEGIYEVCPECEQELKEGMVLIMENHHYLVVRCCDKLLLYQNQKINLDIWM